MHFICKNFEFMELQKELDGEELISLNLLNLSEGRSCFKAKFVLEGSEIFERLLIKPF